MLFFLNPPTEQDNKDTKTLPKSEKKKQENYLGERKRNGQYSVGVDICMA